MDGVIFFNLSSLSYPCFFKKKILFKRLDNASQNQSNDIGRNDAET